MFCFLLCLLLPAINAIVVVQIHLFAIYQSNIPCAFLRNASWSTETSIRSCIWECVHERNCQTAVYFNDERSCSMFASLCESGSIQSSQTTRSSVVCYRKYPEPSIICSTTAIVNTNKVTTTTATESSSTTKATTTVAATTRATITKATTTQCTPTWGHSSCGCPTNPKQCMDNCKSKFCAPDGSCFKSICKCLFANGWTSVANQC